MAKKKKTKRKLSAYNRHVQREMKKGRSMKQAAASWKSGRRSSTRTSKRSTSRRPSTRRTAKKGKVRKVGKSGFNTQKIMKYIRLAGLGLPAASIAMQTASNEEKMEQGVRAYFGWSMRNKDFSLERLSQGWMPFVAATAVTVSYTHLTLPTILLV